MWYKVHLRKDLIRGSSFDQGYIIIKKTFLFDFVNIKLINNVVSGDPCGMPLCKG